MKRALAKQPRDRFASAQEFRQHLMRIAGTLTNHPKTMSDTQIAESSSVYLDSAARQPAQDPLGSKGSTPGVLLPPKRRTSNLIVPAAVVTALVFGAGAYWVVSSRLNTLPLEVPAAIASNDQNPVPETAPEPPAIPLDQALTAATPSAVTPVGAAAPALEPVTNTAGSAIRISELSAPSAGVPGRPPETLPVTSPSVDAALPILGTPSVSPTATAASNTTSMTLDGATKDAPTATQEYTIKPGDTLSKIADTNKVDVRDLQWWNGFKDPDNLLVGKTLYLYERPGLQPKDKFFASLPKPSVSAPPPEPQTSAQAPTELQEPAAPPADSEAKQPAKKKTIKEFFRGIFHK
ncbi:MAG: LysM peptidoglycan-binding domain-containing protein [Candidatus Hydrogenedentes bacterium]|nr:LysM peptidoglycan-binding domain-containing protein [Candidatus Hydrogenedentota bacterium]